MGDVEERHRLPTSHGYKLATVAAGTVLKALGDLGMAEDTIVMYSTDNGPHMGAAAFTLIDRLWHLIAFTVAGGIWDAAWLFGIALLTLPLLILAGGWIGLRLRRR
ncbi:MAG: hypothetical protein U1F41_13150 [Burkholderiales bacterium]